ncbi:hypothetical protein LINGRAHAP2_LOCUS31588 [Linum grandiflorum]
MKMQTAALAAWFLFFFCLLMDDSFASATVDINLTTPSVQLADPQFHDLNATVAAGETIKSVSKSARRGKGGASDLAHSCRCGDWILKKAGEMEEELESAADETAELREMMWRLDIEESWRGGGIGIGGGWNGGVEGDDEALVEERKY